MFIDEADQGSNPGIRRICLLRNSFCPLLLLDAYFLFFRYWARLAPVALKWKSKALQ